MRFARTHAETASQTRDALITSHLGLVHHVAHSLHRSMADEVSLDDLVSAGSLGLINAADNFDRSRGLSFSTFALPRIRGAMLDDLRAQDDASRSVRRRGREVAAARERIAQRTGARPDDRSVARELGVGEQDVWGIDEQVAASQRISLDGPAFVSDDAPVWQFASGDDGPDDELAQADAASRVRASLEQLPARERQVLALYYFEELTQLQIAQVMGVTESRVSQIRSQAMRRLRGVLEPLRPHLVA